ncbi:MAG: hypothetical protein HY271_01945 [Deltaproteobacteria bacterium]|nr:hypothetical protein [Deltaproteobacteria bacterium]
MNGLTKGMLIASAAAALVVSGNVVARATDKAGGDVVNCAGINACKGKGSCAGASNACKAKNECKGKGWVETSSAAECLKKDGKVVEPKKM